MSDDEKNPPAFPLCIPTSQDAPVAYTHGMSLRDYMMIHAPASEIDALIPDKIGDLAKFVGKFPPDYKAERDYPVAIAKARGIWADAMLRKRGA